MQNFYDISLVDGYNLPMGLVYIAAKNTTAPVPPNLTNCACIATAGWLAAAAASGVAAAAAGSDATYSVPWEGGKTNGNVRNWCPWDLLAYPPAKPGDGVYPYPDDDIWRPDFSPCRSQCDATGAPQDCCTGRYNNPDLCRPSLYSRSAKAVCPDAYSFAYDDRQSTFSVPRGGGWEIVFCPAGRSTNILRTMGAQPGDVSRVASLPDGDEVRLGGEDGQAGLAGGMEPAAGLGLLVAGLLAAWLMA